jgi:disulfide bond formation protein DsbB|tara:strand:+ start:15241 stop:15768 length:528 start_codon:yes stop_codon:yes gene_type:complete
MSINLKLLSELSTKPWPWLLLAISALFLELCALFFQYYMGLAPCIMCIYQRVALWGIFLAGIIGYLGHQFTWTRILAYLSWATGAIWGLLIAIEHVTIQSSNSLFYSCEYVPNFPEWLPLHLWLPWLFEATGDCGDINWQFFGHSMPQIMIVTFTFYTMLLAFILITRLYGTRKV